VGAEGVADMRRIGVERRPVVRPREGRDAVLPLDPRDPDVVRVKALLRRAADRPPRPVR